MTESQLRDFVKESNKIEGMTEVTPEEIAAHKDFFALPNIQLEYLQEFVYRVAGARLRQYSGMNVRVGDHYPPPGGPDIRTALIDHLYQVNMGRSGPYQLHCAYETLHPFDDGNGRSGRALWAWRMMRDGRTRFFHLGFLHEWYYQSLSSSRALKTCTSW